MFNAIYKKLGVRIEHIWFADGEPIEKALDQGKADIAFLHGMNTLPECDYLLINRQNTLIKDLSGGEEEAWSAFGKHLKSYIKRSVREGTQARLYADFSDKAETEALFKKTAALYEKMFADKGMKNSFNYELAGKYAQGGNLLIAVACVEQREVGFLAVLHDEKTARLWLSAFDFRNPDLDSQVLSRANQNLLWQSMKKCLDCGITVYDLGGITSFDEPNGIDKFKMQFEKENKVTYNNLLVAKSALGRAALTAFSLYRKLRGIK